MCCTRVNISLSVELFRAYVDWLPEYITIPQIAMHSDLFMVLDNPIYWTTVEKLGNMIEI